MKIKFLAFLLLTGLMAHAQPEPQVIDKIVAVIGNEIVLSSEIQGQIAQLKHQYKISNVSPCEILEDILTQRLMLHQAKLDSIEVTEQQVQNELDKRIRFYMGQFQSKEKMEEYLEKSIIELKDEMHDQLRDQLRIEAMHGEITKDVNITPDDVKRFFELIPADSLPLINSQVEVSQIVVYPAENREEVKKQQDMLEKFREEVKAGKDFAALATLYSDDPGSASQGGDLGMQEKGALVPEFDAVAFSLQNGEISKVFKTQYGYHIVQMIERRGEKYQARHILRKVRIRPDDLTKARNTLDSIITLMSTDTLSFEEAAVLYSQDNDTKNNGGIVVNPQTGSPRFDMSEVDPQISFTIDKLEVGQISNPVPYTDMSGNQGYRILKLNARTRPHRANLLEDYQTIQDAAAVEIRNTAVSDWITKRLNTTYIKIDEELQGCETNYNWTKKAK